MGSGASCSGTARERMLREMAEFVEALGAEIPLVLVLEDLHWSDPSTVDLLSLIAVRPEPARLLVLATYRPVELILSHHPLRAVAQRLATSRRCGEIALDDLGIDSVTEYLERRFAGSRFSHEVARLLRERTGGNPLFLVTLVDHLLARGAIVERDEHWAVGKGLRAEVAAVPETLRPMIEQQLDRLDAEDRRLLEGASLAGIEFSAAVAAVGTDHSTAEAEDRCDRLARAGPLLRHAGIATWPDGTVAGCFAFRHPLYRETLAAAVPWRRRGRCSCGSVPSSRGLRRALVRAGGRAGRALRGGGRPSPRGSLSAVGRADRRGPLRVHRGRDPPRQGTRAAGRRVPNARTGSRGAAVAERARCGAKRRAGRKIAWRG